MTMPDDACLTLVVRECGPLADDVRGLTLVDPEGGDLPAWTPGAHIDVVLPSGLKRSYSLCGDPTARREYRIAVLREADGEGGSQEVHARDMTGTRLEVRPPTNQFELISAPHTVFVAGGIGITPLMPMIRARVAAGESWELHYLGRSRRRMGFVDELESIAGAGERVAVRAKEQTGPVDLGAILAAARADSVVYCCGPERMLGAMHKTGTEDHGLDVHIERFGRPELDRDAAAAAAESEADDATAEPIDPDSDAFQVELRASGITLDVGPGDSILAKAREVKQGLSYNCAEGICGTCETAVIAGIACHRDEVLSDEEKAGNETMMICIGRSYTRKLVLDL